MTSLHYALLPQAQRRLLQQLYRQHGSRMRPSGDGLLWVARAGEVVAGLNLNAVAGGQWLTGLFVAPQWRGQGLAKGLIEAALANSESTTWLFCEPELKGLYERLAFNAASELPAELRSRLDRYRRTKALIALVREA